MEILLKGKTKFKIKIKKNKKKPKRKPVSDTYWYARVKR